MDSDAPLNSKSNTTASPSRPRYRAVYTPTPEHKWVPGIPARNLTEAEVEHFGAENLLRSQCYELVAIEPPEDEEIEE